MNQIQTIIRRDTGCHLHPSCLSCPEAVCIYDLPQPPAAKLHPLILRNLVITYLHDVERVPLRQIAALFHLHPQRIKTIIVNQHNAEDDFLDVPAMPPSSQSNYKPLQAVGPLVGAASRLPKVS